MCANSNLSKRGNSSHVKSVVGMYIRGEKNLADIVHPSKITHKSNDSPHSQRVKCVPLTQQVNAIGPAHKSIFVSPSISQIDEVTPSTQRVTEPIKITSINRIQFEGDDMVIRLKPISESCENMDAKTDNIECSIHPSKKSQKLNFLIEPTNNCIVSEVSLENKNLKLSVNQADSGDSGQIKLPLPDSKKSRYTHSSWPQLGVSDVDKGSNSCVKTTRTNDQTSSSSSKLYQRGKSTTNAAGEHEQINELTKEIRKAEQLLDEYEIERRERMAEEAVATANSIRLEDIEGLLKEFSSVDEKSSDSTVAQSNAGLNHLMADYFREYYNNLRRKIAQFSRERVALLMLIDNLKNDRSKLQTDVEFLRRRLHEGKCKNEICTVSAAPWNCK